MNYHRRIIILLSIALIINSTGCNQQDSSPTPTPSATPQHTRTPTAAVTPSSTSTTTPTPTLTPTSLPTMIGGGSGQLIFQGITGDYPTSYEINIYHYDLETMDTRLMLENFIAVDISPEGSKLLVYQLDAESSPDLKSLVDLYQIDTDGTNLEFISPGYNDYYGKASWLTNADFIVYTQKENGVIRLLSYNPEGGVKPIAESTKDALTFYPTLVDGGIVWADGYYYGDRGGWLREGHKWSKLDGTENRDLPKEVHSLEISPDGNYFLYQNQFAGSEIYIYISKNLDGSDPVILSLEDYTNDLPPGPQYYWGDYFWLPDSQRFFCDILTCPAPNEDCAQIKPMILSKERILLEPLDIDLGELFNLYKAQWSPDGRQFLVECDLSFYCLIDIETSQLMTLLNLISEDIWILEFIEWLP